ncbi:dockerin type I repeat protein [Anaerobacterium chartisolvens]|uniref:Dockerin type I repeat protein n=1 Tax=Anaerobacterium chartisolvens TaxID=1297424 RepID=A0A369AMC3_9FIRM|nr:carbohydrate-binding protein [Anaerobacterium chartisolvens]RCX10542.1 dockerin type I repeat protein [Anaerobacterium chartisolvens]
MKKVRCTFYRKLAILMLFGMICQSGGFAQAAATDTVTVDFNNVLRSVDDSTFGYILTPNYDIPDSRMKLLGPALNRETIPVQTFQGVGDMDGACFNNEGSQLQRCLQAYQRVKDNGLKWYFLLGHNPSWTAPKGAPAGGAPTNLPWFKQYIKDVLQYFKDNGARPDFADLTNEYWTGLEPTFKACWEAVREVYPDYIPIVGPGAVGYSGIPDFYIPFCSANQMDLEGPCWHEYWQGSTYASYNQTNKWKDPIVSLQNKYPETNGKYVIWEENNSWSTSTIDWTRSMANVIRSGITQNIKGCIKSGNWNGMSDILTTTVRNSQQNGAVRTPIWWVYYMFSQLSGQYVGVTTSAGDDFTACASKDADEAKVIIAKSATAGTINVNLNNQPYAGKSVRIDLYKITSSENNGLEYQSSITPSSTANISFSINNAAANDSWMVILKRTASAPSFFHPMTPDDGEAALSKPTLTWSAARDAASYTVKVSVNKDLSDPVISQTGIAATSYTIGTPLTKGLKYYWNVTAVNSEGSRTVSNDAVYSFIVSENTGVPGQFGPYLPSLNAPNESVTPRFLWSRAYNASSYRLVVSKNSDLSSPVINQSGITAITGTNEFGPNTASTYTPTTPLAYNTTYYWRVYAVNTSGERPINGPIQCFTTKAQGNAPTGFGLSAPANGAEGVDSRAVLSWTPSKNAFFYKLEVSARADMSNPVIVRDRMIYNKYTVEPNLLNPNTKYYWRVTAYTKDLAYSTPSSSGIWSFTTENRVCAPLLYAHQPGDGSVKLWFRSSNGATSYNIKYGTEPGVYTDTINGVTSSPYTVTGLSGGTEYYFAVTAVNANGESSVWNERPETPSGMGTPTQDPRSAFTQIEAESFNSQSGVQTETCSEGGENIGYIENGDYTVYKKIDFGTGAIGFEARVASAASGGNIEIRLDGVTGPAVGNCAVAATGGWQAWTDVKCDIGGASGEHDLYLKYTGGSGYLFNLNWFKFTKEDITPVLTGDLNGDGSVNATDYALMKMYLLGSIEDFPVEDDLKAGDLNSDGVIDSRDFAVFKQYLLGIIPELPYSV